jgi:hypothetical protein
MLRATRNVFFVAVDHVASKILIFPAEDVRSSGREVRTPTVREVGEVADALELG